MHGDHLLPPIINFVQGLLEEVHDHPFCGCQSVVVNHNFLGAYNTATLKQAVQNCVGMASWNKTAIDTDNAFLLELLFPFPFECVFQLGKWCSGFPECVKHNLTNFQC
ncbi:hypothetical protein D3C71_1840760 [compost metagenome]